MRKDLSNLYAEKVNSEHPLSFWMLNEQIDYISMVSELDRQIYNPFQWSVENCSVSVYPSTGLQIPQPTSALTQIVGNVPSEETMIITILKIDDIPLEMFHDEYGNFSIGTHIFIQNPYTTKIFLGYKFYNTSTLIDEEVIYEQSVTVSDSNQWLFISHTFDHPEDYAENIRPFIKIEVEEGSGSPGDYNFLINGLTIGEWSENFSQESLGITPSSIPSNINLDSTLKVSQAYPYGGSNANAYYISKDNKLLARNFGVPVVYGSSNSTKLYPFSDTVSDIPSIIFPGFGFLNEKGRYNEYTVEMWIQLNTDTHVPQKMFGPISSNDGLYVEGGFFTLVIDNNYGSHYIGEWMRPMLIQIRIIKDNATLVLNGEEVINFNFSTTSVNLPPEYDLVNDKSNDWVAFYPSALVHPITIDSFAIYSYSVPVEVAKRRWVWGQGVIAPETTNSSLNAITAFSDYSFAKYDSNYNYPDFASWRQGFFNNLETSTNFLSLPSYSLPQIYLDDLTEDQWFEDLKTLEDPVSNKYFTFRPNSNWNNKICYMYFPEVSVLNDPVVSIFGVFESDGEAEEETLFRIENKESGNYFLAQVDGTSLKYIINISGQETIVATRPIIADTKFSVGINLQKLSAKPIPGINKFFSNRSSLNLYLGGSPAGSFSGKIFCFGFDSTYNNRKIQRFYDADGIMRISGSGDITDVQVSSHDVTYTSNHTYHAGDTVTISGVVSDPVGVFNLTDAVISKVTDTSFTVEGIFDADYVSGGISSTSQQNRAERLITHSSNYKLVPIAKYGLFFADIAASGYWQDYVPLSYFAKFVKDYEGNEYYDLDSVQINVDYPEPIETDSLESVGEWSYQDLYDSYADPVELSYSSLDNFFYTGWENYQDLFEESIKYFYYDNEKNNVKTYVSFQYIVDGANNNLIDYQNIVKARKEGVVDPEFIPDDWEDSLFEVVDGTIIYPPKYTKTNNSVDFNDLALVYHLDFNSDGILHHPITFRELQLASKVLERQKFTEVGSRFGTPVYPYYKLGLYYNFKGKNPISVYKGTTPHLYSNTHSGWKVRGKLSPIVERGVSIPINAQNGVNFQISSVQMWARFSDKYFPLSEIPIFSISHKNGTYTFYVVSDESGQRGKIIGRDPETGDLIPNISYHLNGAPVNTPFIDNEEWFVLGIAFNELVDFNQYPGRLSLNGPMIYNNISYFLATNLEQKQSIEVRTWSQVKENVSTINWDYWENTFTWSQVKIINATNVYSIDPSAIYDRYVGSNRIIVDDAVDGILVAPEQIKVYSDMLWSTTTQAAV